MLTLENQGAQGKIQTGGFVRVRNGSETALLAKEGWEQRPCGRKGVPSRTWTRPGRLGAGWGLPWKVCAAHRGKASVSSASLHRSLYGAIELRAK